MLTCPNGRAIAISCDLCCDQMSPVQHASNIPGYTKTRASNNVYVIAIGWLYVVIMIAAVSDSLLKGILRFVFLGALPVGLLLWVKLMRFRARQAELAEHAAPTEQPEQPEPPEANKSTAATRPPD